MRQVTLKTESHEHLDKNNSVQNIIRLIFGIIESFLVLRFFLKFFSASSGNVFVNFIYKVTNFLVKPFEGIISNITISESNPALMIETATIFSLIIVGLILWGILSLLNSFGSKQSTESVKTTDTDINNRS